MVGNQKLVKKNNKTKQNNKLLEAESKTFWRKQHVSPEDVFAWQKLVT